MLDHLATWLFGSRVQVATVDEVNRALKALIDGTFVMGLFILLVLGGICIWQEYPRPAAAYVVRHFISLSPIWLWPAVRLVGGHRTPATGSNQADRATRGRDPGDLFSAQWQGPASNRRRRPFAFASTAPAYGPPTRAYAIGTAGAIFSVTLPAGRFGVANCGGGTPRVTPWATPAQRRSAQDLAGRLVPSVTPRPLSLGPARSRATRRLGGWHTYERGKIMSDLELVVNLFGAAVLVFVAAGLGWECHKWKLRREKAEQTERDFLAAAKGFQRSYDRVHGDRLNGKD